VDLADKGSEVMKRIKDLSEDTEALGDLNDRPHLQHEEMEGFIKLVIRVITTVFKL
jgi:hypothetical protein